ncbi:hypothetical protein DBV05_g8980 [Lasiodiplodia theobromae]|uniref:Uncharacterized protein n=1 Tax=Lasiodiplodia theobromae TaxID=45133 RepID=A0A5N5D4J5_9PEZI|nr:hypothetical protein DBV05_g8980 [Lasiodiplodia theobromae]
MTDRSQGLQPTFIVGTSREIEELRRRPLRDLADLRPNETVLLDVSSPTTQPQQPETSLPPREHTTPISPKHERTPTPDPSQPDPPAQLDPLPKLEQIDSASAETIVIKKERDSNPLKDDPDSGFIDDPKVTVDAGKSWLKVEKSEEDDSGA